MAEARLSPGPVVRATFVTVFWSPVEPRREISFPAEGCLPFFGRSAVVEETSQAGEELARRLFLRDRPRGGKFCARSQEAEYLNKTQQYTIARGARLKAEQISGFLLNLGNFYIIDELSNRTSLTPSWHE